MGHVRVKIRIANPTRRQEFVDVDDALVDTGATRTTVTRDIADRLGLQGRRPSASGHRRRRGKVDHSFALIQNDGKQSIPDVLVNDTLREVLVGVVTLEGLRLAVDPRSGRLVDTKLLLM